MGFRQRVGPDPTRRMEEERRAKLQRGQIETSEQVNQLNGMMDIMRQTDRNIARNTQHQLNDYESAYKKVVDDNHAFRKSLLGLADVGLKEYKKYIDRKIDEGEVLYNTHGGKDFKASEYTDNDKVPDTQTPQVVDQPTQPTQKSNLAEGSTITDSRPRTSIDGATDAGNNIQAAGTILQQDNPDRIDAAVLSKKLNNQFILKGYNQAAALDKVNNIKSTIMEKMRTDERVLNLQLKDGTIIQKAIKDIGMDDEPQVWTQAVNFLKREILSELAVEKGYAGLSAEFITEKLLPQANSQVGDMTQKWGADWLENDANNRIAGATTQVIVSAEANVGDLTTTLQNQLVVVQQAQKDLNPAQANANTKKWLDDTFTAAVKKLADEGKDSQHVVEAYLKLRGKFSHVKKGDTDKDGTSLYSKAYPDLFSRDTLEGKVEDIETLAFKERKQHRAAEAGILWEQAREAHLAGNDQEVVRLRKLFNDNFADEFPNEKAKWTGWDDNQVAPGNKDAQRAFLVRSLRENDGILLQSAAMRVDGDVLKQFIEDRNIKEIREFKIGYNPRDKDLLTDEDEKITNALKKNGNMFGGVNNQNGSYNEAVIYWTRKRNVKAADILAKGQAVIGEGTANQVTTEQDALRIASDFIAGEILAKQQAYLENPGSDAAKQPGVAVEGEFPFHTGENVDSIRLFGNLDLENTIIKEVNALKRVDAEAVLNIKKVPPHMFKLNDFGKLNQTWFDLARNSDGTQGPYTPWQIARANALKHGIPLEVDEGEFQKGEELAKILKEGEPPISRLPNPETKDLDRRIERLNNNIPTNRNWVGVVVNEWLFGMPSAKDLTSARDHFISKRDKMKFSQRIQEIHPDMINESGIEGGTNRTCLTVIAENKNIKDHGDGYGRKGEFNFPNQESALGFYNAKDAYRAETGKDLFAGLVNISEATTAQGTEGSKYQKGIRYTLPPETVKWLEENDPNGDKYGIIVHKTWNPFSFNKTLIETEYVYFRGATNSNYHKLCRAGN